MYNAVIKKIEKTEQPKLLADRFMLESRAFLFPQFHFLFEAFDKKFQHYLEADLIEYNMRAWKEENNLKKLEKYKEPFSVLTLADLKAGFVVWLVPLSFSFLIFGFEWLITFKKLVVVIFIFKKYYEMTEFEQKARNSRVRKIIAQAHASKNTKNMLFRSAKCRNIKPKF